MTTAGRVARATALVLLATAVGFGLIEGLTRLLMPAFDPSGRFEFHYAVGPLVLGSPGITARQVKNTGDFDVAVRINRHGLRDDNDVAHAAHDDLLVVGDSFAWGWGVDTADRFSNLLQSQTGLRTFNVATPGDFEAYAALLGYARQLGAKARRVVIAVCMENDLHAYRTDPTTEAAPSSGLRDFLASHSAAYLFAVTVIHQTSWLNTIAVRLGLIVPNLDGLARNSDQSDIVEASADRLQAIARDYRTLVVLIPSRGLWVGTNRAAEDHVHRAFVEALERRDMDILDLRPLLEATGTPMAFHFANDGHWNARGHKLAADAIAHRLSQRPDVPSARSPAP